MKEHYEFVVARGRRGGGRGRGRDLGGERTTADQRQRIGAWFAGRIPSDWFDGVPTVTVDDEEILVVGALRPAELGSDASDADVATAAAGRIEGFREETRDQRMRIAEEAQSAFGRIVSWGAICGAVTTTFTTASVPVMTRLRIGERTVLDTLVDAGVARSRSDALAWCVRLVAKNEEAWISELRTAFEHVEQARAKGPTSGTPEG